MADLVAVVFVKRFAPYNIGETAGFHPRRAIQFIRGGYAKPVAAATDEEEGVGGKVTLEHVGGGWYQVGDQKVKGKAAAAELAAKLNAAV